jgi:hypothetical protein
MKIAEIRGIAKAHGIKHDNLFKTELIKTIQMKEGNFDCYGTAYDSACDQTGCCWREDCFEVSRLQEKM